MGREYFLERMTWPEIEAELLRGVDALLIPVGSIEQHGHHMPLDTDCVIARELCLRTAALADDADLNVLIAPILNVSMSWYHMQFPGSMELSTNTFLSVFREMCDSLAHHGFSNVIVVNGHGGNGPTLAVAVNDYYRSTGRRIFIIQWWDLAADLLAEFEGPMIHADEVETSIALALGQRVLTTLAKRDAFNRGEAVRQAGLPWTSFGKYASSHKGPGVVVPMDMLREITPSGVVGDATRASLETGERIVAALLPRMVQVVGESAGSYKAASVVVHDELDG